MLGTTVHHAVHRRRAHHHECVALSRQINADLDRKPNVGVYNHFVCHHNQIIASNRGYSRVSGANGTRWANLNFWAVCVLADERFDPPAEGEQKAIVRLFQSAPNGGNRELTYHQRFSATYCPGPGWIVWVKTVPRGEGKPPQNGKNASPRKAGNKQGGFVALASPQARFERRLLRAAQSYPTDPDVEPCELGQAVERIVVASRAARVRRRRKVVG